MLTARWAYIGSLTLFLFAHSSVLRAQAAPAPTSRPSNAQRANVLLDAGELAYAQGRFGDALDCFEAAYRQPATPGTSVAPTLRRIGDAADKLGSHARAIEALKSYLLRVPDARDRVFIQSRIDANQAALDAVRQQTLLTASSAKARSDNVDKESTAPARAHIEAAAPAAAFTQTRTETQAEAEHNPAGPLWIWAAGGAVVVAGIVVAAVLLSSGASSSPAEPVRGNVGSAIQTLSSR